MNTATAPHAPRHTARPPPAASFRVWQESAGSQRWFRRFWVAALVMLVLNLGHNLGLGNINPLERSLFLVAMLLCVWGRPLNRPSLAGLVLMAAAIVLSASLTTFDRFEWQRTAMALVALFTMLGYLAVRIRTPDTLFILRSVSLIPLLSVALGVLIALAFGRQLMMADHTGAMRLGGATGPAFLAASCYAATVASGVLFCRRPSWTDAALIAAVLAIAALSGTRMATACSAATALMFLLLSRRSGVFKGLVLLYGAALVAAFLLTAGDQLVVRFLSGSSSGRDVIAQHLLAATTAHPWVGVGFGHHGLLIPELVQRYTGTSAAHNEFLRLRLELGWVGLSLFAVGWVLMWWGQRMLRPWSNLVLLTLLGLFAAYSSTDNTLFFVACLMGLVALGLGAQLLRSGSRVRPQTHGQARGQVHRLARTPVRASPWA